MKKTMIKMVMAGLMVGIMITSVWAGNGNGNGTNGSGAGTGGIVATIPATDLSEEEISTLLHMREEEKLARDVYTVLNDLWSHWTFENIAKSEQRHMDAILALMAKYGIADPVPENTVGVFADEAMKSLYDRLVNAGSASLTAALQVGATIEDLDITDLQEAVAGTDNADVLIVYQNLMKGSRNHLRTFVYQLGVLGETYEPQYISPEDFQAIVTSPMERGFVDQDGNPVHPGGNRWGAPGMGLGDCPYSDPATEADNTSGELTGLTADHATLLLAGRGKGKGGYGPGDGTGNGGSGPKDGTGNGRRTGTCVNS